jgi:hypothetical protein
MLENISRFCDALVKRRKETDPEVVPKQDILLGEGKSLAYVKRLQGKVAEAYGAIYAKIGEDRTGCA